MQEDPCPLSECVSVGGQKDQRSWSMKDLSRHINYLTDVILLSQIKTNFNNKAMNVIPNMGYILYNT